jgi:hypothetical protein
MSLSVGISNAAGISIAGKSAATSRVLNEASADAAANAPGAKEGDDKPVRTGLVGLEQSADTQAESDTGDNASIAVKVLQKRLQELQEQLREQQQQLAAAQVASYPTPEAEATAVAAIQAQVVETSGAILQVSASLMKELMKDSSTGSIVNTTA